MIILLFINIPNYFFIRLLITKPTLEYYKVKSFILSKVIILLGLISLVVGVFCLLQYRRFSKDFILNIKDFYNIVSNMPLQNAFCLILLVISVILFFFLAFITCYKYYMLTFYRLYIYYDHLYEKMDRSQNVYYNWLHYKLEKLGHIDLFSYIIFLISETFMEMFHGKKVNLRKLSKYHPYAILAHYILNYKSGYAFLIRISPIFFIIYDCIFNHFVINHFIYYFAFFYIPLFLLRRMTYCISIRDKSISSMLWLIYYSEEPILLAISSNYKLIVDSYLASGLQYNHSVDFDMAFSFSSMIRFRPSFIDKNSFSNDFGNCLRLLDNQVYEVVEEKDGNVSLGEKWILIKYKEKKSHDTR